MSSPLNNSNSPNNIRQSESFAIGQPSPAITEEEKKSTKDIGDLKEMGLSSFAVSTTAHEQELISSSTSRSSLTNSVPPNTQPTETTLIAMTANASIQPNIYVPPAHMRGLRNLFQSLCTHGLATRGRIKAINDNAIGAPKIISNLSSDPTHNSKIHLNYVYSKDGLLECLIHPAKGGLSVALEREDDTLVNKRSDLLIQGVRDELSERAHQTILVGIFYDKEADNKGNFGNGRLKLVDDTGLQIFYHDRSCILGQVKEDGSNETYTVLTIDKSNISFIIVPERLSPFIENMEQPKELYSVQSKDLNLHIYKAPVKISCPDYYGKLLAIYGKNGPNMLIHVMRGVTDRDIKEKAKKSGGS